MARFIDLTGKRFGKWVVIRRADMLDAQGKPLWECRCDCGNATAVKGSDLRNGKSKQCVKCRPKKHGHTSGNTPPTLTYKSWQAMRSRCLNEHASHYDRYGGRGISVCERWDVFENFLLDMGSRPSKAHTLERIDNDGNYEPSNCRWATRKEQGRNRSTKRLFTHNGLTMSVIEWCDHLGINEDILRGRLKLGWQFSDAVETPVMHERARLSGRFQSRK